jgi:hypothetical protein
VGSGGHDKSKNAVNNHKGRDGGMKRLSIVSLALVALVGSAAGLYAAEGETFTGAAAASGTHKRPQLLIDGKRYKLKASDKADASVAETLAKFSKGGTGTYVVKGTRGIVHGVDGIIVDSITPAAQPLPRTGVSAAPDRRQYKSYEYNEAGKTLRLTIPEGLAVVRGILVVANYVGGDSRELYREVWYGEFLHLHDFAFLGMQGFSSHAVNFKVMQNALKQLAADSKHPELVHAPYVATGFSAGGGFASRLLVEAPDKVIASVIVASRLNLTGITPTAAHLGTPACIINGEHEHEPREEGGMANVVVPVLAEYRPKGALWGWMAVPGIGHERDAQEVLAMPMLDAAVRLRYPADGDVRKGSVKLKPVDPKSGWIADNTTWKSGLTAITPAKDFKGSIAKSSWLLNEDVAFIYRAYATYNRPLKITSPRNDRDLVWDAGSSARIVVDASPFAGWKKLELYDGAKKVGELAKGPAEFTVTDLKAGYHAFSVLGTDTKGNVRPSDPVLVVVRKPAEEPSTTTEPGVTVLTAFPGDSGPGPKDAPDNSGAVGPDHVVDFTNANVVIHDKKTGKVIRRMTQTEFWKSTKPAFDFPKLNDPRLLYDPLSKRWFAVVAEFKRLSVGYLAVSESSDPTKGWKAVRLPMEPTDPGMKLGVDKNGLYIAFYVLTGDTHTMMSVHAIPIADAIAPDGPSLAGVPHEKWTRG